MLRLFRHHPLYPMRDIIVVNIIVLNKLPQLPSAPAQPRLLQPRHMLPIRCHQSQAVEPLLLTLITKMARLSTSRLSALLQLRFLAQQTYTFSTIIMDHSNVTLLSPPPMISAPSDAATPATNPYQPSCTSRLCTRCNYYCMVPANTHSFRGDHTTFSLRVLRGAQELTTAVSCR